MLGTVAAASIALAACSSSGKKGGDDGSSGGTIKLATEAPTRTYRVVGLIKFSGIGTAGATLDAARARFAEYLELEVGNQ